MLIFSRLRAAGGMIIVGDDSHLHHFGYAPTVCYPKPTDRALYNGLVVQCKSLDIPFVTVEHVLDSTAPLAQRFDVVLDALFGFSFKVLAEHITTQPIAKKAGTG
jgi:NAD(P)H-hydrate repair Nnr-like enzyme with NAD(P)H-hydrate epimerase domain